MLCLIQVFVHLSCFMCVCLRARVHKVFSAIKPMCFNPVFYLWNELNLIGLLQCFQITVIYSICAAEIRECKKWSFRGAPQPTSHNEGLVFCVTKETLRSDVKSPVGLASFGVRSYPLTSVSPTTFPFSSAHKRSSCLSHMGRLCKKDKIH